MKDAVSYMKQFDYNGKLIREITLPGIGTASNIGGKETAKRIVLLFQQLYHAGNYL